MDKKELFDTMRPLIDIFNDYWQTRTFVITDEQKQDMQKVADVIVPGARLDLNCDTCITNSLAVFESYWSREYPKFLEEPPAEQKPKRKAKQ